MSAAGTRAGWAEWVAAAGRRDAALLRWLRRQVNADLRYWRSGPGALPPERCAGLIADCKARLELLRWAESWQRVRDPDYTADARVNAQMVGDLDLIMGAVRRLAVGYRARDGWRQEWEVAG